MSRNDYQAAEEPVRDPEARPLAREMAAALQEAVASYQQEEGLPTAGAAARVREDLLEGEQLALECSPDRVTWSALGGLLERDPAKFLRRWAEVQGAAREELTTGHRASRPVEVHGSTPWQRARFLALRQELADGWQPRNGIERQLLDTMAQAQTAAEFWLQALTAKAAREAAAEEFYPQDNGRTGTPRSAGSQAVEQAGAMVERFNRIFLRTLRALCGLRKAQPSVVVQSAAQVNVGRQQVNVGGGPP
jgi:hypothetical protein